MDGKAIKQNRDRANNASKRTYCKAHFEVINFNYEDVIRTSGEPCDYHQGCLCDGIYG